MKIYNQLNVFSTKVLSTLLVVAVASLTFAGIISLSDAGSFDGDHMQDATGANTTATQQVIRKGWGYIQGNSNFAIVDPVINYGVTFDEVPFLIFNFANSRQVADGAPTNLSECTTTRAVIGTGINQTLTGFQPLLRTTGGTGFPPATYYCYSWVAIGQDSSTYTGWENGPGNDMYYNGDIAVGTLTDADGHGINAQNYTSGKAGVRGTDQAGSFVYAEGMLGVYNYTLPVPVLNAGVLGIKPATGANGAAVYGWNNDDNTENYAGLFVADGTSGTNYGIYSKASGGSENYAGYFEGAFQVNDSTFVNSSSDGAVTFGSKTGYHLTFDTNEVQAKSNETDESTLFLNYWGGHTYITGVAANNTYLSHGGGQVGIRTTSTDTDLHIVQSDTAQDGSGGAKFQYSSNNWKIYHSGAHFSFAENGVRRSYIASSTGAYTQVSDRASKKDIVTLEGSTLDKVLKLKPVTYRYIDQESTEAKTYGFVAQEVAEVFPEIVQEAEDGALGLSYSDFGVLSIKAIQELKAEISQLQSDNAVLKELACQSNPELSICL